MIQEKLQGFALSPQQLRLWRLEGRDGGPVPCVQGSIAARGELSPRALRAALNRLVERHESLRTSLLAAPGFAAPVQVVCAAGDLALPVVDLAGLPPGARRLEADWIAAAERERPFDAGAAPLLRARLLRLAAGEHRLLLTASAYCADGPSLAVAVRELARGLQPFGGDDVEPLQYPLIASWLNDLQASADAAPGRAYWRSRLPAGGGAAGLPLAGAAGAEPPTSACRAGIGRDLLDRAEQTAAAAGVPLAAVLLTAWQLVLTRASGDPAVVVGVYFDGRTDHELATAIGAIGRYLPVAAELAPGAAVGDALAAAGRQLRDGQQWQECFSWDDLAAAGSWLATAERFPFGFELHELPPAAGAGAVSLLLDAVSTAGEPCTAGLACQRHGGGLDLAVRAASAGGTAAYARHLAAQITAALDEITRDSRTPLAAVDLLTAAGRQAQLVEWNDSAAAEPDPPFLHRRFFAQAARIPDRIAAQIGGQHLSYGELARRSGRLGAALRRLGVGPDVGVALFLERSLAMVEAIFGTLEAGGMYVPVDPDYPAERIAHMLADARPAVVLAERGLAARLPATAATVRCLTGDWPPPAVLPAPGDGPPLAADHLAYCIYTSGSTGRPKGVAITHRAISNQIAWMLRRYPPDAATVVFQKTPFSFDASIWEFFVPLLAGARLLLAVPGGNRDPGYMAAACRDAGVTSLQLVPSLLKTMLEEPAFCGAAALTTVFCGGEALHAELVSRFAARSGARLVNLYGPTEATVQVLAADCTAAAPGQPVPLGLPVDNCRVHLLDPELQGAPVGVAGEIYIGGIGLARGYLGRPDATAERFVPDALGHAPGGRLYRTGDWARHLPSGSLEFLGRVDGQLKLRGVRLELGEVEAALEQHPGVRQAVAAVQGEAEGARLVAFFVASLASGLAPQELQAWLKRQLPESMVPALLVELEALPLLPNGKVDRRALPLAPSTAAACRVAPRGPSEELIGQIWGDLLRLPRVGATDDFFALGGHSLLATQLISRLSHAFHLQLPLRAVFNAPTVAGLAALLADLRSGRRGGQAPLPPPVPVPRPARLPLSFAQQRLWFLQQLEPASAAYNMRGALRLRGRLDRPVLARSLAEIVRRHEVLRTRFAVEDGSACQRIGEAAPVPLPLVELSGLPARRRGQAVAELAAALGLRPFDLANDRLLRACLLRAAAAEHVLLFALHHIVADGWSIGVLVRELSTLYGCYREAPGQLASPLPALPLQYADYTLWQRGWLAGDRLAALADFWRRELAGLPVIDLPTDRPRTVQRGSRGAGRALALPPALSEALHALGRRHDATLFMTLLAAFDVLLGHSTAQEDFAVGTPVANRQQLEIEGLIGCFVNMLVLRARLGGEPSFAEVIARVREAFLDGAAHQDLPFEKLAELEPERSLVHHPLFQVAFVLQNAPLEPLRLPGLEILPIEIEQRSAKFDLLLTLADTPAGLRGALEYATDLFDGATVGRLLGHFEAVLAAAVAAPQTPIAELPLLSTAERHQLGEWSGAAAARPAAWPPPRCLHQLFEEQVDRAPDRVAAACEDSQLTYRRLDELANALAGRLAALGAGPETRVGVAVERSLDLLVGLLAVLKTGAAYVPLDPSYPGERLANMIADARVTVLLAQPPLVPRLRAPGVTVLAFTGAAGGPGSRHRPASNVQPANLAYVIFTSGSTGRPRGVLVSHANGSRLLGATEAWFGFGPDDVWTLFHSFAFDFSVWEMWGALAFGGRLLVVPYWTGREPEAFHRLLVREGVTVLNQTPSAFRQLMAADAAAEPESRRALALRCVVFGGEALDLASLRPWVERHGVRRPRLINMYGITETTVHVTYRPLDRRDVAAAAGSVIGRPIPDLTLHVVGPSWQQQPIGAPGELWIGGAGLARGYCGQPDRTAEKFVPDPWADEREEAGARLYRSGDLGRRLANGDVQYLGRIDHQVKVRGFRIELGEIEAALAAHPGVGMAVVVMREELPGERRLVAYLVAATAGSTPPPAELRRYLVERLPEPMVPAAYVELPSLPLSPNGKVDRRALPVPERPPASRSAAPRTAAEEVLAEIWADLLKLPQVGTDQNFFELGGDSILSIQVVSRANRANLRLTPRLIFQHPTIAELAALAGSGQVPAAAQGAVHGEVALTPVARRFFAARPLDPHHMNQALLLAVVRPVPSAVLERAVARLVEHHDALRLRFTAEGDRWRQAIAPPSGPPPFLTIDLSSLPDAAFAAALAAAAAALQASLDLERGPLLRVAWFPRGSAPGRLLIVIHHLAVDGVSWRILLDDLVRLCEAPGAGGEPALPAKTTSFMSWSARLGEHAAAAGLRRELAHWTAAARPAPPLPLDSRHGANTAGSARSVSVSLPAADTRALLQEAPRAYRTRIADLLLAALVEAFAVWTGERSLWIDLEGHGRDEAFEDLDLSRTVGWFTAIYPVWLELPAEGGPAAVLKAVKEQLRSIPGRGLGYDLLRFLDADPAAARMADLPQPEVSFNYLGQFEQALPAGCPFAFATEPHGPAQSPRQGRWHLIDVHGLVHDGRLRMSFTYSESRHRRATVQALAGRFLEALRRLLAHCLSGATGCTPSDFPLAALTQPSLDRLASGRDLEDLYPLSPLQLGLLFHSLDAPGSGVYFRQLRCRLRGELNVAAFRRACEAVVLRHPILRTAFAWEGLDEPLQLVLRGVAPRFAVDDWSGLPDAAAAGRWQALLAADQEEGFDLRQPPLMRLTLVRTSPATWRLLWSFHHLICDGWSFPLVVADLLAAYEAARRGTSPSRERSRPFRDYIAWLREQDLGGAERFWREYLAGFTTPTPLPVDRPRSRRAALAASAAQAEIRAHLAESATVRLQEWTQRQHLTVATALYGAWALLLSRYGGGRDVVFGTVSSGRPAALPGIEGMLGVFINTLPVRLEVPPEAYPASWLRSLLERQAAARELEYSPLSQVQSWSEVPRGTPLFSSLLAFENYPVDVAVAKREGGSLEIDEVEFPEATNYPLTLMAAPGRRLPLRLLTHRRAFEPATAVRMLGHFQVLLAAFAESPAATLAELPLLAAAERHQLLLEWNDTATAAAGPAAIHHLFERQAAHRPQALAVAGDRGKLTYGEVERRANQIARQLLALGVGRGDAVAVFLDRVPDMVPALLGVLKAGAAYLPLDADYPAERLQWILGSLGARVVLTESGRLGRLAALDLPVLAHAVCLGDGATPPPAEAARFAAWGTADLERRPATAPHVQVEPEDAAYVIFTSGSTGRPKGVKLRHGAVVNVLQWVNRTFDVGERDRVLFITSLCFDLSVYDIFGLLAAGGVVRIAGKGTVRDPAGLLDLLRHEPITIWDSAPAALQQLAPLLPAAGEGEGSGLNLRQVLLSGDWIPIDLPDAVRSAFPRARVAALGGATEAAIWSNHYPVGAVDPAWPSIPYGRPIDNARYHVLDPRLAPCPLGVAGDLYIGGDCLADGYAAQPDLTADRFVPDPCSPRPGGRAYRTGDRARYLADGNLEFLGRLDQQVKIRGFRIELGEIEAVLAEHPEIRDSAVVVRTESDGRRRLVAAVVARRTEWQRQAAAQARLHLQARLPSYMIPGAFVVLPALPLTPNGKVDRKALAALSPDDPEREHGLAAPRTAIEEQLAAIWRSLLRLPEVSVHDNFFALGGDSILSIQIVARAAPLGIRLGPHQIFEHPTIAELAAVVGREDVASGEPGCLTGPLPIAPPQHWFLAQELVHAAHFNQAILLASREPLVAACLARAAVILCEHHDALRLRFTRTDAGWQQSYAAPEPARAFFACDLTALPRHRVRREIEAVATSLQGAFDLTLGPVFRLGLLRAGDGLGDRVFLAAHHLAVDGVSWRVLLGDLEAAYGQAARGEVPALPAKTTSYRQWSAGLARFTAEGGFDAEIPYWSALLAAAPPELRGELAGGANTVASAATVVRELAAGDTETLLQLLPHRLRVDADAVLLAALVEALAPWTGERRLLVELEGHGREPVGGTFDLSRTVGWFTSFVPVLLDLRSQPGLAAGLKAVKETLRTRPSRGVGFGALRYLVAAESPRAAACAALGTRSPQIGFNYLGQLDRALDGDSRFHAASESMGPARHPGQLRRHLLEVGCSVAGGRLRTVWTFSRKRHARTTIEQAAERYVHALSEMVRLSRTADQVLYTPSDFPLAALDQEAIDRLFPGPGVEAVYPLSPTQQGMLFFRLYAPRSDAYFQQLGSVLEGDVDPDCFRAAWAAAIARHDVLRTGFVWEDVPEPLQVVWAEPGDWWHTESWADLPETAWPARIARWQRADRERGFDLAGRSQIRVTLIRLRPRLHYFAFSFHHLLMDGWSLQILTREVLASYADAVAGRQSRPAPVVPYRAFLAWVRSQDRGRMERFWRRALDGFAAPTRLPGDRQPGSLPDPRITTRASRSALDESETETLRARARHHALTLNTLVQGAWALLLGRHGASDDVVYGATVAGRPADLAGVESMVGLFINTLPVRIAIGRGPAAAWLAGVQEQQARMRQFEWSPLLDLPAWSQVAPGLPLFESILVFENYPVDAALADWQGEMTVVDANAFERTSYAMTLVVLPRRQLALNLGYDRQRFDAATVDRLQRSLRNVLLSFAAGLDRPVDEISMLSPAESHQLLREWNDTRERRDAVLSVPELIAAQAAARPAAAAVVAGGRTLTYGELAARSTALAMRLRRAGVGPEVRVALLLPRSAELIVAVLAILQAGGAYVPLDPATPAARLAALLDDCGAAILVSRPEICARLPKPRPPMLAVGEEPDAPAAGPEFPATMPLPAPDPRCAVYVIYTSGSTGRPKGVVVTHASLASYAASVVRRDGLGPGDRVLQFASISFDASAEEIFPCLLAGATLVLRPEETLASSRAFLAATAALELTVLNLPTAFWHGLAADVAEQALALPAAVRLVIIGGEAARPGALRAWAAGLRGGGVRLLNTYGPTETTIVATAAILAVAATLRCAGDSVPIGRPISGVTACVLDEALRPLPIGATGELYLGGSGVARGYLAAPATTAERFLPDPFAAADGGGARLYRSGDLARLGPDGQLELLGRADTQVKIRGFRVEPGEIEAAVLRLPAVRQAVVVARERLGPGLELVAYLVTAEGRPLSPEQVRTELRRDLPDYMVPARCVVLDELPRTASGKIDRRRLPAPEAVAAPAAERTAPRGPCEALIAELWADLLAGAAIGIDDNFFALGGHSLLAVRLVSRIRHATGVELPLRSVFDAPTVAAQARAVERALRGAAGAAGAAAPPLAARAGPGAPPLSFGQERLWFLDRLAAGGSAYHMPFALRVSGALDVGVLGRALAEVVRRHEVLRTTFAETAAGPVQVIHPPPASHLPAVDLASLPAAPRDGEVRRRAAALLRRPFDLAGGPLLRAVAVRLAAADHVLLLCLHHIVADGWSVGVLSREIAALYAAFAAGLPSPLPELAIQYADFAVWQREWLRGDALEGQLAWWRRQLAGVPAALDLPADRPRRGTATAGGSAPGGHRSRHLPAELLGRLERLGRERGATLFMVLLAAWQGLLARWARTLDVCVGTPAAGRSRLETEHLIGFFVNTLVLRGDLAGSPSGDEALARTREACLGAYAHDEVPFEKLVQELQPERSLSRSPLFQVMLVLERAEPGPAPAKVPRGGLEIRPFTPEAGPGAALFDLTLAVSPAAAGGLALRLEYAASLFDGATAFRLLGGYLNVLQALCAAPASRLLEMPLLDDAERAQLLVEWASGAGLPASGDCLHELFERQAAATPEATALVWDGGECTYADLERRSARLAERLAAAGVGPEVRVALCLRRSPAMLAAMLAVLRAGGAYVPLDPAYPVERLAFMLRDSRAAVLVAGKEESAALAAHLPAGLRVLRPRAGSRRAAGAARRRVGPDQLAYLLYTSGSTGRPKAVALAHRGALALARWARDAFSLHELSGVLAATSISFDLSVFELLVPLCWGGTAVLAENALQLPAAVAGRVRLLNTVPSVAAELLRAGRLPAGVETVCLAGEPLRRGLVREIQALGTVRRLLNLYGPTEDTTYSTACVLAGDEEREPAIGRPLPGGRALVLDGALLPSPAGVTGELCLGGVGLARGYFGRPRLTASRFVPDPYAGLAGERLYRTGDLARFRPDGELEVLGRLDDQVKLRGFRIELGEIEAALGSHPRLRSAAAVLVEEGGDRRLAALVVLAAPPLPAAAELRDWLARRLPAHMVPARFVEVAALPRTATGKLDRRAAALLAGGAATPAIAGPAVPRTFMEDMAGAIWCDVLRLPEVGREDDFFAAGGHSLLAIQVISRVRRDLAAEVPVRALFESPTLAGFARVVEGVLRAGGRPAPPIGRAPRDQPLPLSFGQERLWFLDLLAPGRSAYNMPFALRIGGALDLDALGRALAGVVRRHEVLRTTFAESADGPVQVISEAARVPLPTIDLAALPAAARDGAARLRAARFLGRPFDLARGPLLRAAALRLGGSEHVLLLCLHHAVADAWSLGVLAREIATLYAAFAAGAASPLPELPLQYADFALWQREWLQGEVLESHLAYWRSRLAGLPAALDLPADRQRQAPRAAELRHPGGGGPAGSRAQALPGDLGARLERLGRDRRATLFMVLLAAFQGLLARWADAPDLAVGTPVAGRSRAETEGLIGFFVNTLVLRGDYAGAPSFDEALARTRESCLGAYTHDELPFEKLVHELQPARDLTRSPFFQVMFLLEPATAVLGGGAAAAPDGLAIQPFAPAGGAGEARFDLLLAAIPAAGGLAVRLEYAASLFDGSTAERLLDRYARLLAAICEEPARPLPELPALAFAEQQELARRAPPGPPSRAAAPPPRAAAAGFAPPAGALVSALAAIWEEVLGVRQVLPRDDFFALGGHSLLAVRLMSRIRRQLGRDLPLAALFHHPTLEQLAAALTTDAAAAPSSPIVTIQAAGDGLPFVCVHAAAGEILCYRSLALALGEERPFLALQSTAPPGGPEDPPTIEEIARRYVAALGLELPSGRYLLGGWSMGGTIAWEMARQRWQAGNAVPLVALIDPAAPVNRPPREGAAAERELHRLFAHEMGAGLPSAPLPEDEHERRFQAFGRRLRALQAHTPLGYGGPVALFTAAGRRGGAVATAAWLALAGGAVAVEKVPGDHYSLLRPPHVATLAARLRTAFRRAQTEGR